MAAEKKLVQVKLDARLLKAVDIRAVEEDRYRGQVMEDLLRKGLAVTQGRGHRGEGAQFD